MFSLREELPALAQLILDLRRKFFLALDLLDLLQVGAAKRADEVRLKSRVSGKTTELSLR